MKLIEIEALLTAGALIFGLLAVVSALKGNLYPPLLYVSLFLLIAAKGLEIFDRIEVKE
jgi:hypothetical protein